MAVVWGGGRLLRRALLQGLRPGHSRVGAVLAMAGTETRAQDAGAGEARGRPQGTPAWAHVARAEQCAVADAVPARDDGAALLKARRRGGPPAERPAARDLCAAAVVAAVTVGDQGLGA